LRWGNALLSLQYCGSPPFPRLARGDPTALLYPETLADACVERGRSPDLRLRWAGVGCFDPSPDGFTWKAAPGVLARLSPHTFPYPPSSPTRREEGGGWKGACC